MYTPLFRRFGKDTKAVSAVEFAVLLPVMIMLLLGSFDVARAVDVKNKTSLLSRTVSDFVSQGTTISKTELDNIVMASGSVMYPYSSDSSLLQITVESVRVDPNAAPNADPVPYVIDWTYKKGTVNSTSNTNVSIPAADNPPDTSVIRAKIEYTFKLKYAGFVLDRFSNAEIVMNSSTFMSPRWGTPITASWTP